MRGSWTATVLPGDMDRMREPRTSSRRRSITGRPLRRGLLLLAFASALLGIAPAALAAKAVHGELGSGSGLESGGAAGSGGAGGQFFAPRDVAVNESGAGAADAGDLYVVDRSNHRLQAFDRDGNFKFAVGRDVVVHGGAGDAGDGFERCTVALDCQQGSEGTSSDAPAGELSNPNAVAVDQDSGEVFVVDHNNRRVQVFDAAGAFVRMWGWDVVVEGAPEDTAGDQFEVCTIAADCKQGVSESGVGGLRTDSNNYSHGIAISAPDGNAASGTVFVADTGNRRVNTYNLDGSAPGSFGSSTNFASGSPKQIAVDSRGIVYASDTNSSGQIDRYDTSGVHSGGTPGFLASILSPALGGSGASNGLELDLDSDGAGVGEDVLYVLRDPSSGNTVIRQYGPLNDPGAATAPTATDDVHVPTQLGEAAPFWLGLDSATGTLYTSLGTVANGGIVDGRVQNGVLFIDDDGAGPDVTAALTPATDVAATTATLNGVVDPDGLARWRMEISANGTDFTPVEIKRPANGSDPITVSATASGLVPNTTYRYRMLAEKVLATNQVVSVLSAEGTFITDASTPTASTTGATQLGSTSATLTGLVNPNGSSTSYRFEYGPTTSYGKSAPIPAGFAGSGGSAVAVSEPIDGLAPATTYHYRLVADSPAGTQAGADMTFTTRPTPASSAGRGYELVSPPDKLGGHGLGDWYQGLSSHTFVGAPAVTGEHFLSASGNGGVLMDAPYQYANDAVFDHRTPTGWTHEPAITRGGYANETSRIIFPRATSEDLTMSTWGANGAAIHMFPEQENWPSDHADTINVRDRAGHWEPVLPLDQADIGALETGTDQVLSVDGSTVLFDARVRGLAGAGDPTLDLPVETRHAWLSKLPDLLTDSFPGASVRVPLAACTAGTLIPAVTAGKQDARPCPAPAPGRDAALIDSRGSSVTRTVASAVSADGSRAFFMSPVAPGAPSGVASSECSGSGASTQCPPQVYVREERDGVVRTRWISRSAVADQDASLMAPVVFEAASADGDKVFLRTAAPLTADDPNGGAPVPGGVTTGTMDPASVDLFMYDMPDDPGADPADGTLTRISGGPTGTADANVGNLRVASSQGARVYFTSHAPIAGAIDTTAGITTPGGDRTPSGEVNLYLYDTTRPAAQRWRFVARIPTGGLGDCAARGTGRTSGQMTASQAGPGAVSFVPGQSCVRATRDGSFVRFFTHGRLTADDPDGVSGDMYAFDALSGELVRVSAPQGGAGGSFACGGDDQCFALPGLTSYAVTPDGELGLVRDAADGARTVFFTSASRLVAQDVDDAYDVYEWRDGELSLLSVETERDASYHGNDTTGRNVYIATRDRLTWQDHDAVLDVYTARVGGGIPQPDPAPVCAVLADGCQQAGAGAPMSVAPPAALPGAGLDARDLRASVALAGLSRAQRGALAAGRTVRLALRVNRAGRVRVFGRARVGGRSRLVLSGTRRATRAGTVRVALSLSRPARRQVSRRGRLAVSLRVSFSGAPERLSRRIVLRSVDRTNKSKRGGVR
ncbi:MAG TPA: NHL repeat-containing protein [Thermoleophilaceae bacterium]|nr:NHL repeat-containing protein [Thermoleophilaceae bacterium]